MESKGSKIPTLVFLILLTVFLSGIYILLGYLNDQKKESFSLKPMVNHNKKYKT